MPASVIFDYFFEALGNGDIDPSSDTFKETLVSGYTPSKGAHQFWDDANGDEITGTGYTAGGQTVAATIATDDTTHLWTMTFADTSWATSTISADGAIIRKSRGGSASADELICYIDFGGTQSSGGGTFLSRATSPLTIDNS